MARLGAPHTDFEDGCPLCGNGEGDENGSCFGCDPAIDLAYTPIRASFAIDTASGRVGWSGDCVAPEYDRPGLADIAARELAAQ